MVAVVPSQIDQPSATNDDDDHDDESSGRLLLISPAVRIVDVNGYFASLKMISQDIEDIWDCYRIAALDSPMTFQDAIDILRPQSYTKASFDQAYHVINEKCQSDSVVRADNIKSPLDSYDDDDDDNSMNLGFSSSMRAKVTARNRAYQARIIYEQHLKGLDDQKK